MMLTVPWGFTSSPLIYILWRRAGTVIGSSACFQEKSKTNISSICHGAVTRETVCPVLHSFHSDLQPVLQHGNNIRGTDTSLPVWEENKISVPKGWVIAPSDIFSPSSSLSPALCLCRTHKQNFCPGNANTVGNTAVMKPGRETCKRFHFQVQNTPSLHMQN